jgi:type IV secretion system protein TrbL
VRGATALANRARNRSESSGFGDGSSNNTSPASPSSNPGWAQHLRQRLSSAHGVSTAAHIVRGSDRGGTGANPSFNDDDKHK